MFYVGAGISGGETGALTGPSVMPGGSVAAWPLVKHLLQAIAARLDDGTPCCEWIGPGGAGHYVKMVHNGIEYGDMQLIAEAYLLLKDYGQLKNDQIAGIFEVWNRGELNSYLTGITSEICRMREVDGSFLLDHILDVAGQKGTGKLTAVAALEEGDPLTLIVEAVLARFLSALPDERKKRQGIIVRRFGVVWENRKSWPSGWDMLCMLPSSFLMLRDFLCCGGLLFIMAGGLDYGMLAKIWRKGCIIRSVFLEQITRAYENVPELENLLFDDFFRGRMTEVLGAWRKVTATALVNGIPVPCMASALTYFDGLRTSRSSANLIQAQRDYFGAHTYERTDASRGVFFHTDWNETGGGISGTYNE